MKQYQRCILFGAGVFLAVFAAGVFPALSAEKLYTGEGSAAPFFERGGRGLVRPGADTSSFFRTDRVIVKFADAEQFERVPIPSGERVEEAIERFSRRDDVLYAEPDYVARAFFVPNDPYYSYQWHLDAVSGGIDAEEAWDLSQGEGTVVAVVDTGIAYEDRREWFFTRYYQAPDLADTAFVPGYDFVNNDTHPNDDEGHGTHVAGTIAQSTNNSRGVSGVAHKAALMPVKVLDSRGSGTYSDVAEGIRFAADNGADVINLSLGGPSPATYLEESVRYAYEKGVTVVAAAGNDGKSEVSYPAAYDDYVIAVGATRFDEEKTPYSNYGARLDLVAPGGDLNVDQNGDGYGDGVLQETFGGNTGDFGYYFYQGTSMAAPHAAGVAALVIAHGNAAGPDEVRAALSQSAKDLGEAGWDELYGHGLVSAIGALLWQAGPVDEPPRVSFLHPAAGTVVSGGVRLEADASDDAGLDRVEFLVGSTFIGVDTEAPYEVLWDSTAVADGSYTLFARAFDSAGQSVSDSVAVVVDNVNDPPVALAGADISASDADGDGVEDALLDGSGSYDPDGSVASFAWEEGGVFLGTAERVTRSFAVGTHTVILTVADNDGATSTDSVDVTVLANQPPTADAGSDIAATTGEDVLFGGSGSFDSDGSIESYNWNFGDGSTASGESAIHDFAAAGTYVVELTVRDNGGASDTDSLTVTVSDAPALAVVFADSFEVSEWNGLWSEDWQNAWSRSSAQAEDGAFSAAVSGFSRDASLTSHAIDLGARTDASVTFSWFMDQSLGRRDYVAFDISTNGGKSWQETARLRGGGEVNGVWHGVSHDITSTGPLTLRFRGNITRWNGSVYVDDVSVLAR